MKSIVSFIEGMVIGTSHRHANRSQKRSRLIHDASSSNPLGWVLCEAGIHPQEPLVLSNETRARHLYILGATGCGKTNLILGLLRQDFANHRSVAVVDLRGDLVDRVLTLLASSNPQPDPGSVSLLDLRDPDRIVGFNPLVGCGDPHSKAYLVLDALKAQSESWGIQLEETLRNCLIALAEARLTLLEIEPMLADESFRNAVLPKVSDPSVHAFFARYSVLSTERQQSWMLPVLNKVTPLLGIPRLRLLFGASSTIDIKRVLDTPGHVLLVSLAVDRFHSAARLVGSLIIGAIESAVMSRVEIPERNRTPVNFYVDEFESMATEAFTSIVAEGRRFGLSLTLSHQNLSQIPTNLRSVIRNNVQTQVFFQTGSVDARELRHELHLGEDEDVVVRLQTLPIGQAFVHKRPDEPVLVQFEECKEPVCSKELLRELTDGFHLAVGSSGAAEVQQAIAARKSEPTDFATTYPATGQSAVLHHDRLPRNGRRGNR